MDNLKKTSPAEGTYACKVLSASTGNDYRGLFAVQINVQLADGPDAGKRMTYEQAIDAKSIKYAGPSCKAVGHQGGSWKTLADDCAAWIAKTGGMSTVEIKHFDIKKPEAIDKAIRDGREPRFAKANAIGRGASQPLAVASAESQADADAALRVYMGGGGDVAPVEDDQDVPFVTCSLSAEPSGVARVLRGTL